MLASWKQNIRNWTLSTSYRQSEWVIVIVSQLILRVNINTNTNTNLLNILHPLGHLVVAHVVDILDKSIVLLPEAHLDQANNNWLKWGLETALALSMWKSSLPLFSLLLWAWVLCSHWEDSWGWGGWRGDGVGSWGGSLTGREALSALWPHSRVLAPTLPSRQTPLQHY